MLVNRTSYGGQAADDVEKPINSFRPRPRILERRATVENLSPMRQRKPLLRQNTLDSIRALSTMNSKSATTGQDNSRDMLVNQNDPFASQSPIGDQRREAKIPLVPRVRSISFDDGKRLTETEKRYLDGLDQRRDALDTKMFPPFSAFKYARGEAGRCSLPVSLGLSHTRPLTPVHVTKMKPEDSFGNKEDLYEVDMHDGKRYVCRKRDQSLVNPDLMTAEERRIHEFLKRAALLGKTGDTTRAHLSRVYSFDDSKLVVDPMMSKFSSPRNLNRRPSKRILTAPKSVLLPPLYRQKGTPLMRKDFSLASLTRVPPITDEYWDELKDCRYLRPPPRRYPDIPEELREDNW